MKGKRIVELAEEFNIVDPIKHHSTISKFYIQTNSVGRVT